MGIMYLGVLYFVFTPLTVLMLRILASCYGCVFYFAYRDAFFLTLLIVLLFLSVFFQYQYLSQTEKRALSMSWSSLC